MLPCMNLQLHGASQRPPPYSPDSWPAIDISRRPVERSDEVLTPAALALLARLHRQFNPRRLQLLAQRMRRQADLDRGVLPDFLPETAQIRADDWRVAAVPADLADRRVEITGPVDRKMIINALNAPVRTFMADFEDSCSPTWENLVSGQVNLHDAVRRRITHFDADSGKSYRLNERIATLIVRPRGWHLPEKHVQVDGAAGVGCAVRFRHFSCTITRRWLASGSGPYFYLPKLESHLEARLWNDVFNAAQDQLGMARGTIKATVLIETILAAFEMDEILYELREHSAGPELRALGLHLQFHQEIPQPSRLRAARPRRGDDGPAVPEVLRRPADPYLPPSRGARHRRHGGADPGRGDRRRTRPRWHGARRQAARGAAGHDGTWIAHPALAPIANEVFDAHHARAQPAAREARRRARSSATDLLRVPEGPITDAGLRTTSRRPAVHRGVAGRQRLRAALSPDGGCGHGGDLPRAVVAMAAARGAHRRWRADLPGALRSNADRRRSSASTVRSAPAACWPACFRARRGCFPRWSTSDTFDEFLTLPAYELLG